eukprot:TRINITY_DN259_c4_g1_i1.p1 TRINITY_DN259_c4_g1~~TRINITY_DN259_c4_g1_i1.p1  ORF type:complete len:550 (-),score=75.33 TRINITY_DN259_c4_g1_i1:23-1561(-)
MREKEKETRGLDDDDEFQLKGSGGRTATKIDITLMLLINFLSSVCFAVVLPSLWPFLSSLGATKSSVGWAVAANSIGSFIASPILGVWADRRGVKEVIFYSLILMVIGNFLYAISVNWIMLVSARFIVGASSANYGPASAYLSYATKTKDRTLVMTLNSGASVLGFILGPTIATIFTFVPDITISNHEIFTELTSPGWASLGLALLCVVLLIPFRDIAPPENTRLEKLPRTQAVGEVVKIGWKLIRRPETDESAVDSDSEEFYYHLYHSPNMYEHPDEESNPSSDPTLANNPSEGSNGAPTAINYFTVSLCCFLQFVFFTAFTIFETISTAYTESAYNWGVFYNGLLYLGIGISCIGALILLFVLSIYLSDVKMLVIFELLLIGGFAALITYPFNSYTNLPQFIIAVIVASVGFSPASALLITMFSKLNGEGSQGTLMGYLSASGSIARTVGPIVAGYVNEDPGPGLVFLLVGVLLFIGIMMTVLFRGNLELKTVGSAYQEESEVHEMRTNR